MSPDISPLIENLIKLCANSPKKVEIIKAVRKEKSYEDVAEEIDADSTYVSSVLNKAKNWGLVDGQSGRFRQTKELRAVNIDAEVRRAVKQSKGGLRLVIGKKPTVVSFSDDLKIPNPGLPDHILLDAKKMLSVYPYLYLFENSVRNFIIDVMAQKHGPEWWKQKVGNPIQSKAEDRMEKDGRNRWHGKRGQHPIFYVDIDDLRAIITTNEQDFRDKFPAVRRPLEWVQQRIEEIEISRNVVAHNNPLADNDIARLKVYFKDWVEQMKK